MNVIIEHNQMSEWIQIFQIIILAITALIVWWYTCETKRLREETEKQTRLLISPLVVIHYEPPPDKDFQRIGTIIIKNIGNNSALNIRIHDIKDESIFKFPHLFHLQKDGRECLAYEQYAGGERVYDNGLERLFLKNPVFDEEKSIAEEFGIEPFKIEYSDLEHNRYMTKIKVGVSGFEIQDHNILGKK